MKKNRKFMAAGIITLAALSGIGFYAFADTRDSSTVMRTESIAAETAATTEQMNQQTMEQTIQQTTEQTNQQSGISATKAKETALESAVTKYGIQESSVRDLDVEREYEGGKYVWEVTFDAEDQNNRYCEYEYLISCEDGTVSHHHMEYEDIEDCEDMEDCDDMNDCEDMDD